MTADAATLDRLLRESENRAARDRADRLAWERATRAAIIRDITDRHAHYAWHAVAAQSKAVGHWNLTEAVRQLPDKPTPEQLQAVRGRGHPRGKSNARTPGPDRTQRRVRRRHCASSQRHHPARADPPRRSATRHRAALRMRGLRPDSPNGYRLRRPAAPAPPHP